jgi:hypothetical protein
MADRLDEFSKDLAKGTTRREALRRIGAVIAGAMLAATGLDRATAAPSRCAVFCSNRFPPGPARASCMQVCRQCNAQVSRVCFSATGAICCPEGSSCCRDYQTGEAFCCPSGQQCCQDYQTGEAFSCEGSCCQDYQTGGTICCPSGQQCCQDYQTGEASCAETCA